MENLFSNKKKMILGGLICVLLISVFVISSFFKSDKVEAVNNNELVSDLAIEEIDEDTSFYVDIKGAVKKPGVYEVKKGSIVNDLIKLAGGLKTNASTNNINLSQKLSSEMVVYIFTKSELKKENTITSTTCTTQVIEVNNCIDDKNNETKEENNKDELININKANLEELMRIPGVGESKAKAIIEYRLKSMFVTIEDIMKVSGFGESTFAKIKDYITV